MSAKARFFNRSAAEADHSRHGQWSRHLEAMAEGRRSQRVLGRPVLLTTTETPIPALQVTAMILASEHVESAAQLARFLAEKAMPL